MKQLIATLVLFFFINTTVLCQDYVVDYPFSNGYTLVYKKLPPASPLQKAPEKIYGVINSEKKLVVPMLYKSIMPSGENGIFIIKDGADNAGIFSVPAQKLIVEPQYFDIEGFSEGLAVIKKRKPDYGFLWGAVDVNGSIVIPFEYDYLGVLKEGLVNFQKENKMGFLDKNNKVIIPAMYYNFSVFSDGLAAVKVSETGKYGYIDKSNTLVIAAEYEDANPFYGGFTSVAKKKGYTTGGAGKQSVTVPGQWVVINKTGKIIQERSFDRVSPLNAGGLFIIESNGKKGTMNTQGMPILPMEYSDVTIDKAGYTVFKTIDKKKYGMMNNTGSIIVAPNYDYVSPTTANRFYVIQDGKYTVGDVNNNVFIQPDSANGVILGKKRIVYYYTSKVKIFDLNGNPQKTFTDLNLKNYGHSLSETEDSIKLNTDNTVQLINLLANTKKTLPFGEAGDFNEEGIFIGKQKLYDFYDYNGKRLNTKSYYSVVNFSDGICALQDSSTSVPHLADKNFNKVKDLYAYFQGPYSEGLAYAHNGQGTQISYLDKKGLEVFNVSAKEGSKCKGGLIAVKDKNNKYFLVNKTGKQVNTKTWDEMGDFSDGLALVKENAKWGYIDMQGNKVIDLKFDIASSFTNGAAIVKLNDKFFLINKKGEPINNNKYEAAGVPDNGTFPVQKDGQAGLIDSKGNTIIDFKYNRLLYMTEDRVWASKDGKWGLLDNKGKALTEFIYQGAYDFSNGYARVMLNDKVGVVDKTGKLILPAEYKSLGSIYKNTILGIKPAETVFFNLK
ncbi:MAG: WG repeat-containing protein [Chitinophagaceae bacterium]|nr:WG repeat-containing protein [Chitinophagaceae bacterium]MBK8785435.1 WG repeat-containing protein [Chitinophagaceae bacterium]